MKKNRYYLFYELRNIAGNWYILFFGALFPIIMGTLITKIVLSSVPEAFQGEVATGIMLSFLQMVPLAVVFLGHGAIYSQELENRIPLRMQLFGRSQGYQMFFRMLALMIVFTAALLVDLGVLSWVIPVEAPTLSGFLLCILAYYLQGVILFMLAHGISNFLRKFGPAYAIEMILYFTFMLLGGMMGVRLSQMPKGMKWIAELLPFGYVGEGFINVWLGKGYDMAPFFQACLFLGSLSAMVMLFSFSYRKKRAI